MCLIKSRNLTEKVIESFCKRQNNKYDSDKNHDFFAIVMNISLSASEWDKTRPAKATIE